MGDGARLGTTTVTRCLLYRWLGSNSDFLNPIPWRAVTWSRPFVTAGARFHEAHSQSPKTCVGSQHFGLPRQHFAHHASTSQASVRHERDRLALPPFPRMRTPFLAAGRRSGSGRFNARRLVPCHPSHLISLSIVRVTGLCLGSCSPLPRMRAPFLAAACCSGSGQSDLRWVATIS